MMDIQKPISNNKLKIKLYIFLIGYFILVNNEFMASKLMLS